MSMMGMQTVMARLCVDHEFRQAFVIDPDRALEASALTAKEAAQIKAVDIEAVREYAGSLLGKRIGLIRKWLPLSLRVLTKQLTAPEVNRILERYGLENIRGTDEIGGEWVRGEFQRVSEYLRRLVALGEIDVPYLADVLKFEAVKFWMLNDPEVSECARRFTQPDRTQSSFTDECQKNARLLLGKHACLESFDHNLAELMPLVEKEGAITQLEVKPSYVLFFKKPDAPGVANSTVNLPLKQLIELCDGTRTIDGVVSSISSQLGMSGGRCKERLLGGARATVHRGSGRLRRGGIVRPSDDGGQTGRPL